jgi:hypothetical protein
MCKKYSIDESHGLKHAKGTYLKARILLGTVDNITDEERRVTLYSAALHDTCDSKYTDVYTASLEIKEWLLGQDFILEEAEAIIAIITTMSYSKLKATAAGGPPVYPDHGKWQRAYHIARHADLLEGYIVARCFLYNMHIHPTKAEYEHWVIVSNLFDKRVFKYVNDRWIQLPGALALVPDLIKEAQRCFDNKCLDWPEPLL